MIKVANEHIAVSAMSIVWSDTDRQLVAAQLHSGDKVSLNAIKAELEKWSNKSGLSLAGDISGWVAGAKHGFVNLWTTLERVNAHGNVLTLLHRHAHDPRMILATAKKNDEGEEEQPHFYIVARQGDDLKALFIERLQLALPWPLRNDWADMLLKMGQDNGLVEPLMSAKAWEVSELLAEDEFQVKGLVFTNGLRVVNDANEWGELISSAVEQEFIQI
jgi:hypothetical protein